MDSLDKKSIILNKKTYTLDSFGFLHPPEQWDINFANEMVKLYFKGKKVRQKTINSYNPFFFDQHLQSPFQAAYPDVP
jgi:hypothetical protein